MSSSFSQCELSLSLKYYIKNKKFVIGHLRFMQDIFFLLTRFALQLLGISRSFLVELVMFSNSNLWIPKLVASYDITYTTKMKGRNSESHNLSVLLHVFKLSEVESSYINITLLLWDCELPYPTVELRPLEMFMVRVWWDAGRGQLRACRISL